MVVVLQRFSPILAQSEAQHCFLVDCGKDSWMTVPLADTLDSQKKDLEEKTISEGPMPVRLFIYHSILTCILMYIYYILYNSVL